MLNANNTVNYEINVKQKEKKYSWSTVFAWLYLRTIGRILPKKWNKWAENILYYNTTTGSNETHTDKTTDESAQIDLKPEVTVKESQSEIVSEDEKVQTDKDETTFQNTTMQTECVETTDKNIEADLKPEVAEKGSQSEIISKDGEVQTEENSEFTGKGCFDTIVNNEFIDEDYDSMEEVSTEEDEELKKQLEDVSQELEDVSQALELEHSQNVFLKEEKRELQSIIEKLEKDYKKLAEDAGKREEELVVVKEKDMKINSLTWSNEALEQDKKEMKAELENLRKHLQSTQESKQQLEKEKIDLEGKLKDLNSQLSAAEVEKKSSENEVARLQEQVQTLEESKEWELAGIGDTLNKTSLSVMELLAQQLPLNNQEQQLQGKKVDLIERLKAELKKESDEELQETREKIAEQEKLIEQLQADIKKLQEEKRDQLTEKAQRSSIISLKPSSTAKSTTGSSKSTLSKLQNLTNKLLGDKNLNNFLSKKNEELKKDFPEFKEKHFCHNVRDETIKSLLNQDDGKFKSSKLLELLESSLKQSAREIIEAKVKKVVNEHSNIGKNVDKELQDGTLKAKLSPSVRKCVKELEFNKQKEGVNKIVGSILHSFNSKNNNNNDSGELLKEIVVKELVETRMELFSDKIQELQLASSIRDKFLSPDQKMCSHVLGEGNTYQLSTNKISRPNSSMSHTNIASIHSLNSRKAS